MLRVKFKRNSLSLRIFCRRNPNRPYQVYHLFDRQAISSPRSNFFESYNDKNQPQRSQKRKSSYRRKLDGTTSKHVRPVWEPYSSKTQKYLAIGGFKGMCQSFKLRIDIFFIF